MMILLRQLAFFTATGNIFIRVSHIAGKKNVVADCLSRLTACSHDSLIDFSLFFELQDVKELAGAGAKSMRKEVKPFPAMNWNGLVRGSKLEHLQSVLGERTTARSRDMSFSAEGGENPTSSARTEE